MNLVKTWNDPTVIADNLPQAASHKTILEDEFLTKVLIFNFPVNKATADGQASM